jgi:homocysteine S-methyltransferase
MVDTLKQRTSFVLDGAIATQLQQRGYNLDKALWSCKLVIDQPEAVEQLHYDYYRAGADICTSCSYVSENRSIS